MTRLLADPAGVIEYADAVINFALDFVGGLFSGLVTGDVEGAPDTFLGALWSTLLSRSLGRYCGPGDGPSPSYPPCELVCPRLQRPASPLQGPSQPTPPPALPASLRIPPPHPPTPSNQSINQPNTRLQATCATRMPTRVCTAVLYPQAVTPYPINGRYFAFFGYYTDFYQARSNVSRVFGLAAHASPAPAELCNSQRIRALPFTPMASRACCVASLAAGRMLAVS